jgi:hypothetical protein
MGKLKIWSKPDTAAKLKEALAAAPAPGTPGREALLKALGEALLWVEVEGQVGEEAQVRFVEAADRPGSKLLLAFSGKESAAKVDHGGAGLVQVQGRDLFRLAAAQGIDEVLVDSGGPASAGIDRQEMEQVGAGPAKGA